MTHMCSLARAWDDFDAYLFDIDGTLLHCRDAVHYFAFCDVLSTVADREMNLEGVSTHGNTDIGILRDAFARAGIAESIWRPKLSWICETMGRFVEQRTDEFCITTLPKVQEVLHSLRNKGAVLGVATGNLEKIGKRKLEAAGLLDNFHFGGWSDTLERREDVFRRALEKARHIAGPDAEILVLGDTPADICAARANGLPIVAVATGIYSFDQLQAEEPDLCVHSMEALLATV